MTPHPFPGRVLRLACLLLFPVGLQAASDVTISAAVTSGGAFSGTNPKTFTPSAAAAVVQNSALLAEFNASNSVNIETASAFAGNGDITISANVTKTAGSASPLTLNAVRDIVIGGAITSSSSTLPLILNAGRNISSTQAITTNGGSVLLAPAGDFIIGGGLNAGLGAVTLQSGVLRSSSSQTITTSGGLSVGPVAALRLQGTVSGPLNVAGSVSPAAPGATGSLQVNGSLTLQSSTTTNIEVGGTSAGSTHDKITATGAVTVAGSLSVDLVNNFHDTIAGTTVFTILQGSSITGTFNGYPNGSRYTLTNDRGSFRVSYTATTVTLDDWQPVVTTLTWDPGTAEAGSAVFSNVNTRAGRHYFKVTTQTSDIGGWRSRLTVSSGEASLYFSKTALPTITSSTHSSVQAGSDGLVLRDDQFGANEEWNILVFATEGAQWSLFSGKPFVHDLGALPFTDTNGNSQYDIGEAVTPQNAPAAPMPPEGIRFYKTAIPTGTPAWSLWLGGSSREIALRSNKLPFHNTSTNYVRKQASQMLVVSPVIGTGSSTWFSSIVAPQGEVVGLDSRIQFVSDLAYNGSVNNVAVTGAPYRVYRVQVPVDQIAWDINAVAVAGNPDIAVRKGNVPAEFDNEAFSASPGSATEGVTLVPNYLTDGTWYITVWGAAPYTFSLKNGDPVITPLSFTDTKVNDQPTRAGWRFFALTDVPSQVGALGWELQLSNHVPGTQLALRRNKVPSRWQKRENGAATVTDSGTSYTDEITSNGFFQRVNHQADVWYVGVFLPQQPLGAFTLEVHPVTPPALTLESSTAVASIPALKWRYYRMDIGTGMQGWDLRLTNATGGNTTLVVRRDLLPLGINTNNGGSGGWNPSSGSTWPTGHQWAGSGDWTSRAHDTVTTPRRTIDDRIIAAADRPLVPGTYYIGIYNDGSDPAGVSGQPATVTLESRGIGNGRIIPIQTFAFTLGNSTVVSNLPPREAAYYKVTIPDGTPSWEFTLEPTVGEASMVMRRGTIPDLAAVYNGNVQDTASNVTRQVKMQKSGPERYLMLPENGQPAIAAGDYYIGVISEGLNPPASNVVGGAPASATLTNLGPISIQDLGAATASGILQQVSLGSAQTKVFQFTVPVGTASLELRLDNRVGNPQLAIISGTRIPQPDGSSLDYGTNGGQTTAPAGGMGRTATGNLLNIANPVSGIYTLTLRADESTTNVFPEASTLLSVVANSPVPLAFNEGTANVTNQAPTAWRYFQVTVPEGIMGWDLRLKNITSGNPQMVIRRDQLPSATGTLNGAGNGWNPSGDSTWPTANQWGGGLDWTGRTYDTVSTPRRPVGDRVFAASGRPLAPGNYIVGVFSQGTDSASSVGNTPASYSIESRGVGVGQAISVGEIPFAPGTSTTISNLVPREAAYFKITVPPNTPRWEFTLTPTVGEAMLVVRRGALPDFNGADNINIQSADGSREVELQRTGMERYLLLPENNQDFIVAGDYYLAIVSEGADPAASNVVGGGPSSATFTTLDPMPVVDLGTINLVGTTQPVAVAGAQVKAYRFTVPEGTTSLEVGLQNKVGNPQMAFISGLRIPQPDSSVCDYGVGSGQTGPPVGGLGRQAGNGLITIPNPPSGIYTLTVRADSPSTGLWPDSSADVVIKANAPEDLPLGGGSTLVTNHAASAWKYFRITVPAGINGWDLRLKNITGGDPTMVLRRDVIPSAVGTNNGGSGGWNPSAGSIWPTGHQWGGDKDYTERLYDSTASAKRDINDRIVMAMGRPLQPGTYYLGIQNSGSDPITGLSGQVSSYTIESRFIGAGQAIQIADLGFAAGSSVTLNNLVSREASYFRVSIPQNTRSWEFTFAPIAGESLMVVRQGFIPDFNAAYNGIIQDSGTSRQAKVQKAGAERYLLLPPSNEDFIVAGDYYIAVVAEGVNPPSNTIGSGTSSGTLTSNGSLAIENLGTASLAPVNRQVSLAGAQTKGYQFTVPEGVVSLELQLNNRTGMPRMALVSGNRLPFPDSSANEFATNGGQSGTPVGGIARVMNDNLITVANPPAGTYSLTVRADDISSTYPDATADLVIVARPRTALNFAASQNGNGLSHSDTKQLAAGQKQFYEIAVPATLSGQPVLGWIVKVNHGQGDTTLNIYKQWGNPGGGVNVTGNTALIVPPFLTFNETWFIEVTATGLTQYTITSQPVTLERPAWTMPTGHNFTFGDSGNDIGGNPLPGDRGVDIGQDDWHIYAVDVPAGNSGLLRTELRAISGNPDLYIREDGVPTTDHDSNGAASGGASMVHREMKDTGSEYGNWVPLDGQQERQLRPGRWFFGVKAGGTSNARYRLIVSNGQVTDLDLSSASVNNQTLIGRDWRYYRFTVPADAPATWNLGFTQQVGDVVMWLRDTVPPGQNSGTGSAASAIESWSDDKKNQGPYSSAGHDAPAVYPFDTPPLRPGHTYYAGFRAATDATFSLTSTTNGSAPVATAVSFYNGTIDTSVPAGSSLYYKIAAPAEGTRLKWTSTHAATVQIRVEQGTYPGASGTQHSNSAGANSTLNQALTTTAWPWQPAQTYYLRIVNSGATAASVKINIAGQNAGTEDEDNDGLLDAWERAYFPSITTHNGAADPDGDGVTNAVEFTDGTIPNDINSAKYFLTVNANFGTVAKSPELPKYDRSTVVTLTPTPNAGLVFTGWTGGVTNTESPLLLTMLANMNINAGFGTTLPVALDTNLSFTTGGDGIWTGQTVTSMDGVDAAQSGPITHGKQSWMETTVNGPGELAFAWKVSSQAGDYLEFYIDGVLKTGRITGNIDWVLKSYAVEPGPHTLRWRYVKDGSVSAGSDAAWVDGVSWMPASSGYNAWLPDHFSGQDLGNPAIVGPDADPDADGLENLIEYAFDLDPTSADDSEFGRVIPEVVKVGGKDRLRLRFKLPAVVRPDVLYQVEVSNTLGDWTVIADRSGGAVWEGAATCTISPAVGGRCENIVTDDATVAPTGKRMGRISVSLQ